MFAVLYNHKHQNDKSILTKFANALHSFTHLWHISNFFSFLFDAIICHNAIIDRTQHCASRKYVNNPCEGNFWNFLNKESNRAQITLSSRYEPYIYRELYMVNVFANDVRQLFAG